MAEVKRYGKGVHDEYVRERADGGFVLYIAHVAKVSELERRLHELEIRIRDVTFEYKVPDRYRRVKTAYSSGYESGWRGKPLDNPYSSPAHQDAYATGWRTANLAVLLEIDAEQKEQERG